MAKKKYEVLADFLPVRTTPLDRPADYMEYRKGDVVELEDDDFQRLSQGPRAAVGEVGAQAKKAKAELDAQRAQLELRQAALNDQVKALEAEHRDAARAR